MRRNSNSWHLYGLLGLAMLLPQARADTFHVPADYATIQSCIDAAVPGPDFCLVAPGTYHELLDCHGKTIAIQSSDGAFKTIIDGTGLGGSVIKCEVAQGNGVGIVGFTITGGAGQDGAGIYLRNANLNTIISDNVITNNSTTGTFGRGGGVFLWNSQGTFSRNEVSSNSAGRGGGLYLQNSSTTIIENRVVCNSSLLQGACSWGGGGIFLDYSSAVVTNNIISFNSSDCEGGGLLFASSNPTIIGNTINGNTTHYGGGIYGASGGGTIRNNTILGNSALFGGGCHLEFATSMVTGNRISGNKASGGGGLNVNGGTVVMASNTISGNAGSGVAISGGLGAAPHKLTNNVIIGNQAASGGGVFLQYGAPLITNNTVAGNRAANGGGIYMTQSSPIIANNIIARNTSGVFKTTYTAAPIFRNNCIGANSSYNFSGLPNPTGANSNISDDPWLADLSFGNGHIQPGSVCVNKGNNSDVYGTQDIDGTARIQPTGGTVDIGADESDGTTWPAGPYAIVRVSPSGDDANDGSSWANAMKTIQAAIDSASVAGGELWVKTGTYQETLTLHPYAYLYGGFSGAETTKDERNWATNIVAISGQRRGSVASIIGGYRTTAIDGFVLTDGDAQYGGGLHIISSTPRLSHLVIERNRAYRGGGIYIEDSLPSLDNISIRANSATEGGGGIYVTSSYGYPSSTPTVANTTISGNTAQYGAFYFQWSSPTIINSIIAFNSSGVRGYVGSADHPFLGHNCVFGNDTYDYLGINDSTGTNGNISSDPLFAVVPTDGGDGWGDDPNTPEIDESANDELGDLRLQWKSPAIDAGEYRGGLDLGGNVRAQCNNTDIGAYEFAAVDIFPYGDFECDGRVNLMDWSAATSCITGPFEYYLFSSCWRSDFDEDGDVDLIDIAQMMLLVTP